MNGIRYEWMVVFAIKFLKFPGFYNKFEFQRKKVFRFRFSCLLQFQRIRCWKQRALKNIFIFLEWFYCYFELGWLTFPWLKFKGFMFMCQRIIDSIIYTTFTKCQALKTSTHTHNHQTRGMFYTFHSVF